MSSNRRYVVYKHLHDERIGYVISDTQTPNYDAYWIGTLSHGDGLTIVLKSDIVRTATLGDFEKNRVWAPPNYPSGYPT